MLKIALRVAAFLLAAVAVAGWVVGPFGHVVVSGHSMEPSLRPGDLVLTLERRAYRRGDVVAARVPAGQGGEGSLVIHRIVGGSAAGGYVLRGDNREHQDLWRPHVPDVQGEQLVRVPFVGLALAYFRTPLGLALLGGAAAAAIASGVPSRTRALDSRTHLPPLLPPPAAEHGWPISS